ncbi:MULTISPECIES: HpcH/HpaI aldolase/citrate lyase family protein [Candidatus Ichthyocystis]|uniref:HpcH/HpaI aldolase/citrate lyase family protein n=1 Tax=Candidatus Ichthyocystis TaxID=2929841 RepID=UPI000AC1E456|nr:MULTISPECIES: aldolase/citrate lyase family protein [Ichthyocystis]
MTSPDEVLWDSESSYGRPLIPCCDHYAGNSNFIKKAIELQSKLGPVMDITLDCDDGAVVNQEKQQIDLFIKVINGHSNQFSRIGVRVHSPDSAFFEYEVESLIKNSGHKIAYLTIPKVQAHTEFKKALSWVSEINEKYAPGRIIPVHPIIETIKGARDIFAIAAEEAVECLSFGIMDFVSSYNTLIPDCAMKSPEQFIHPLVVSQKEKIVTACAEHGCVPSHNVTIQLNNPEITYQDAKKARYLGFTRMWSIHPSQIEPIISAMAPSNDMILYASDVLLTAQKNHWGPIKDSNNELKDRASYRYYWQILKTARTMNIALPERVKLFFDS